MALVRPILEPLAEMLVALHNRGACPREQAHRACKRALIPPFRSTPFARSFSSIGAAAGPGSVARLAKRFEHHHENERQTREQQQSDASVSLISLYRSHFLRFELTRMRCDRRTDAPRRDHRLSVKRSNAVQLMHLSTNSSPRRNRNRRNGHGLSGRTEAPRCSVQEGAVDLGRSAPIAGARPCSETVGRGGSRHASPTERGLAAAWIRRWVELVSPPVRGRVRFERLRLTPIPTLRCPLPSHDEAWSASWIA